MTRRIWGGLLAGLPDEDVKQSLLRWLSITHIGFLIAFTVLSIVLGDKGLLVSLALAGGFLAVVVLMLMQRAGFVNMVRVLTPAAGILAIACLFFSGYGLQSVVIPGLLVVVLLGGLLGGRGSVILYGLAAMAACSAAYYLSYRGWFVSAPPVAAGELLAALLIAGLAMVLVWTLAGAGEKGREEDAESSRYRRLLLDNARDFIWMADRDMNFTYVSPSSEGLTGYSTEELLRMGPLSITTDDEASRLRAVLQREEDRDVPSGSPAVTLSSRIVCKDGAVRWVETSFGPIDSDTRLPAGVVGITRDITDRIALEERKTETFNQLHRVQRMESIGQLAGGIAHDFNNLLLAIHGYAELIRFSRNKEETDEYVQELLDASDRASNLTRQLLVFSRQQALQTGDIDLQDLVGNTMTLLGQLVPDAVSLRMTDDGSSHRISGDASQIEQVIMNLCVNARDAIRGAGEIELALAREFISTHGNLPKGHYVRLDVRDDGIGISEAVLDRVFDPFFTTKPVGEGRGLGMSVVHGIVKEHGGWVDVSSKVGEGTTVSIWFPERDDSSGQGHEQRQENTASGEGQTILVVDDDAQVRSVVSRLLTRAGYNIIEASNGREGLEAFRLNRNTISLVISDIVMPEMSGREFAAQEEVAGSGIPIVFMSGYRGQEHDFPDDYPFVSKPFSANELLTLVSEQIKA